MRIALTRPQRDAERTASALRERGHDVSIFPLMEILPVAADMPDEPFAAILMTSSNAARHFKPHPGLSKLTVLAVGDATAQAARDAGYGDVVSAAGNAKDLAKLASERFSGQRLLYFAGENRTANFAELGLNVRTAVVYRAAALPFPLELVTALKRRALDAVMHFSRRNAGLFVEGAEAAAILPIATTMALTHFCLSEQVAEPLEQAGAQNVLTAMTPDEASLLALAG